MASQPSKEMLKVVFKGKIDVPSGADGGGIFSLAVDHASSIVLVLLPASSVILVLHSERPITDERRLSIRKRSWDAEGVAPSASTPFVGMFDSPSLGDQREAYRRVEDRALGVVVKCRALEFGLQT